MKKIEKRALLCLLFGLILLGGVCFFIYEDWNEGGAWAVYEGNRDVYADGDLAKGALYDTDGELLMRNTADGMIYNDDADVRAACMHITGDRDNNISTGANRVFLERMIGFDFIGAAANGRALNFASNIAAAVLFTYFGLVDFSYAIPMGLSMIAGAWCGARMALSKGTGYVRPLFIIMTTVLIGKQLVDLFK